ncbi:MAG: Trk family potassium uptake protein, partial [Clostridiales bacterium]|nr:Trk family potassium uptake protein [Clostridiales bacterium]
MRKHFRLSTMQVLVIGFALVIVIGGALLSLPFSNRDGQGIPYINGLFTAASATCVTGLIVYDTYTQFSLLGQAIILVLIQIGGLGFMFVAITFSLFLGRRISLRQRSILMESVSALKLGGIVRLTKKALLITLSLELLGAVILASRFIPQFGFWPGLWCGIFHSVSAFCNAGFDILGRIAPYSSLVPFASDAAVNITIAMLIIIGGLGFFVWDDITEYKWHVAKYHLHSKIILTGTLVLIVGGALLFYVLEAGHTFKDMNTGERILASFFASVTPRTAGYNSVPVAEMSEGGTFLSMLLMLIGAGPGSTGGGMKVSTVVVILLAVCARIRNREDMNIYSRRLEDGALRTASTSAGIYLVLVVAGTFILCGQGFDVTSAVYEVLSGIGTVGLTRGITPSLPFLSKLTILLLMYAGR